MWVLENDREVGGVTAHVAVSDKADEALLSDKLISRLGIVLLDIGEGLWCFKDELGRVSRKSL